jgi:hypothetical protein
MSNKSESRALRPVEPAAGTTVQDELRSIDTSLLDQLLEIGKDKARLEEYRHRATELKNKVQDAVWERVTADYEKRFDALTRQAAPLKARVRLEYRKLRSLIDRITATNAEARLEKEELEFRHAVGELPQPELEERLRTPAGILERCHSDLAALEQQKARFAEAFDSAEDLESAVPASDAPPAEDAAPIDDATSVDLTTEVQADATNVLPAARPPIHDAPHVDEGRTFMLPLAGVIVTSDDTAPVEYRLAALNYLGRSEDNQIQIARPGVSRRHALVAATASGFSVKDLQSQNGTFVNGERITERPLADGDTILIGDTRIVFRSPWPAQGAGRSAT